MATDCEAEVTPTLVAGKVSELGENVIEGAVPVPERVTVWGEPPALSVMVMVAEKLPAAEGVNASVRAQVALAASEAPQVLAVMANAEALTPPSTSLVRVREAVPVLVRVRVWAALAVPAAAEKAVRVESESAGAGGAVPVPVSVMVWGEVGALSVIVAVPVSEPAVVGRKPKVRVQLAPATRGAEVLQVLVRVKLAVAARAMLVKLIDVLPALVSVTVLALALVPTVCEPKATAVLESVSAVTLVTLGEPPPLHPAMRKKQGARTASERFLRSIGDLSSDGLRKPTL